MAQALRLFTLAVAIVLVPVISYRPVTRGIDLTTGQLDERDILERLPSIMDSYFIQNIGQIGSDEIMFYSSNGNVFFTPRGVTFRFRELDPIYDDDIKKGLSSLEKFRRPPDRYRERGVVINYTFVDANPVIPKGKERCLWNTNYFKGNDPGRWYSHVPDFYDVVYENVWDGIDIVYKIKDGGVKYDIIVRPGSDPRKIGFEITGQERLRIDRNGDLVIGTKYWDIFDSGLVAYYLNEEDKPIDCGFQIKDEKVMGYEMEPYDTTRMVVIDPLIYSTLIGSGNSDLGGGISKDPHGNITITGQSMYDINQYPTTSGAYDRKQSNIEVDTIVTQFTEDLSSLVFSTLIGGDGYDDSYDNGIDIAVDEEGFVYTLGLTRSNNFPTTKGSFNQKRIGIHDVFLTKFNKNGSEILFSLLVGGEASNEPQEMKLNLNTKMIYIVGSISSGSDDYPTTYGSYDRSHNGDRDGFISVFDFQGKYLLHSTLFGGEKYDHIADMELDPINDKVIITGYTNSISLPTTNGCIKSNYSGNNDVFISIFNLNLSKLLYSTYFGGVKEEEAYGISFDNEGNIYITGYTRGDFPITENAYDTTHNGNMDVFITKVDPNLSTIIYSTYIGGNQDDIAYDIVVNDKGCAIITGKTKESPVPYPTTNGAFDREIKEDDAFISLLTKNGSFLKYSTYIGGKSQLERGLEILLETGLNISIIGTTPCYKNDFPTTENAFKRINNGYNDIFVIKMYLLDDVEKPFFVLDNSDELATTGDEFTFNATIIDNDRRLTDVCILYRFGIFSYMNISLGHSVEGKNHYYFTISVPSFSLLPLTYYFYATDYARNVNTTVPRTVEVRDNDCPVFYRDISWKSGTTGEPVTFEVDVRDNIAISSVQVEYWGTGGHLFANLTGAERYSVTVNVPEDTVTMNYIFHAVDTSGNWNHTGKRSFDIRDNDAPYFGPDITSNVGYTGNVFSFISDARDNIGIFDVSIEYWFGKGYRYNESMKGIGPYIFNVTVPEDSLDTLYYRYSVVDVNGLWNNTEVQEVRIEDDDPPVFGKETFSDLVTTGDEFEIELVVKDNIGVQGVYLEHWFCTGERTNVSMKGFGPYMTKVHVPESTEGPFNYVFHSFDGAGNWGRTGVRTRTVYDNDGPIFGIDNTDKDCTTGDPFTFRTKVTDNIGVKEVFVEHWFGTGRHTNLSMTGTDGYICSITIPPSPSLTLWYKFTAVDGEGNWAESIEKKMTVIDDDAPEIGTDQTPSSVNTSEKLQFKVTASDNIGIVEAFIEYRYGDGPETKVKMSGLGYYTAVRTYTYDVLVPVNSLEPIQYTIVLSDQAGNKVEKMGTVTIIDSIPPMAEAGTNVVVKQGTIVVLNGSASSDNIGITNWTWTWEEGSETVFFKGQMVENKFEMAGTYTVTLTVTDGSGNIGTDTITVKVESSDERGGSYLVYILLAIIFLMFVVVSFFFLVIKRKKPEGREEEGKVSQEEH